METRRLHRVPFAPARFDPLSRGSNAERSNTGRGAMRRRSLRSPGGSPARIDPATRRTKPPCRSSAGWPPCARAKGCPDAGSLFSTRRALVNATIERACVMLCHDARRKSRAHGSSQRFFDSEPRSLAVIGTPDPNIVSSASRPFSPLRSTNWPPAKVPSCNQ